MNSCTRRELLVKAASACLSASLGNLPNASAGQGGAAPPLPVARVANSNSLPVTFPYEMWNGMILITASVKDQLAQRAVLAINYGLSIWDFESAQKASMRTEGIRDLQTLYGSRKVPGVAPTSLHIDKVQFTDVVLAIDNPLTYLTASPQPDAPTLWIGNNVLQAVQLVVDPSKLEVTLKSQLQSLPIKGVTVPFELLNGRIVVQATAHNKTFQAYLDTSSMITVLPPETARTMRLAPEAALSVTHPNGKKCKVSLINLNDLALGNARIEKIKAIFVSEGDAGGMDPNIGVIGNDFLQHFRLTVSYTQKKLVLEEIPAAPKKP
jgi:hypothetical protein